MTASGRYSPRGEPEWLRALSSRLLVQATPDDLIATLLAGKRAAPVTHKTLAVSAWNDHGAVWIGRKTIAGRRQVFDPRLLSPKTISRHYGQLDRAGLIVRYRKAWRRSEGYASNQFIFLLVHSEAAGGLVGASAGVCALLAFGPPGLRMLCDESGVPHPSLTLRYQGRHYELPLAALDPVSRVSLTSDLATRCRLALEVCDLGPPRPALRKVENPYVWGLTPEKPDRRVPPSADGRGGPGGEKGA